VWHKAIKNCDSNNIYFYVILTFIWVFFLYTTYIYIFFLLCCIIYCKKSINLNMSLFLLWKRNKIQYFSISYESRPLFIFHSLFIYLFSLLFYYKLEVLWPINNILMMGDFLSKNYFKQLLYTFLFSKIEKQEPVFLSFVTMLRQSYF